MPASLPLPVPLPVVVVATGVGRGQWGLLLRLPSPLWGGRVTQGASSQKCRPPLRRRRRKGGSPLQCFPHHCHWAKGVGNTSPPR